MKAIRQITRWGVSLATVAMLTTTTFAQLQITEVMFDTESSEPRWEWFELRNTGAAIDLNGGVFRDLNGNELTSPNIDNTATPNTVVPANGVAVFFNATGQDESVFRQAWNLAPTVPLVGVTGSWTSLNNGGDHFGIWPSFTDYQADLGVNPDNGDIETVQFNNALVNLDYNGFPDGGQGISSYWRGTGDINDGTQWATAAAGVDGAYQSTFISTMDNINSTDDVGNPGIVPGGVGSGLQISEIMYNPRSTDPEANWEWIEVVNNTGATLDFASQAYFLDDASNDGLTAPNITEGTIADGEVAILFNENNDAANITGAWGAGLNVIPVSDWSSLNNGGDTIGIWDSQADYDTDAAAENFANAVSTVVYTDDPDFPADDGNGSIHLTNLSGDPNDGLNWALSASGDSFGSFNASGVGGVVIEHNGNDFGSPGVFGASQPAGGDFNGDGNYDCADVDALVDEAANGSNTASFDLTGDGIVDRADVQAWLAEAGEANIGPGRAYLEGDANLDGSVDVGDFNIWNGSKFTTTAAWCSGDFNADGSVDVGDFNLWNGNKFQSSDVSTVPEPGSFLMLLVGLPLLLRRRK